MDTSVRPVGTSAAGIRAVATLMTATSAVGGSRRTSERSSARMLDAEGFLAFTTRLRSLHERVEAASISDEQRRRWHRRLAAISGTGAQDLERAAAQLTRFEAEVERSLSR